MRTDRELLEDALKLIEYGIRSGEAHDITEEIRARLAEKEDGPMRLSDVEVSELMNGVTGLGAYKGFRLFADKIMDAMLEKNR